jgi:L-glyceraldehyde 3-phosphate reductase
MYNARENRYEPLQYRRCGSSGLKLPAISLGLWHNFGGLDRFETMRETVRAAFDRGITHFDLANNYGPPPGSAEENFGRILAHDLAPYRDQIIVSTKAGFLMWPGPYGEWGSRKYLVASLDQSLKRMGLDYVDIFYHHRPDPDTPIEETMETLDHIARQGKALYVGISNYSAAQTRKALEVLKGLGRHLLIHQANYSMFNRWIEDDLRNLMRTEGSGIIAFCPLAQGLLTNRYLGGVPEDSRARKAFSFLKEKDLDPAKLAKVRKLNDIAHARGQTLAQMSLAWVLRDVAVTSALIGASKAAQVEENVAALDAPALSAADLAAIDTVLAGE